ncbi:predicted protein [Postia placenta Mad-698-R]|nr:predicted protein [Postia placenta Mad-698-R]
MKEHKESWQADAETVRYITQSLRLAGRRPTNKCWDESQDAGLARWTSERPMSPALSMRAIRETPNLGSGAYMRDILHSGQQIPGHSGIDLVSVDEYSEETPVVIEEAISLQPGYRPSTTTTSKHSLAPEAIADLPELVPKAVMKPDDDEDDLYKQHMVVVNGWQAFEAPSSPTSASTPPLADSSSDIDELFMASPPGSQQPLFESLMSARMDDHELPRSERFRGLKPKAKAIGALGEGQSLVSFLEPLVSSRPMLETEAKIITTPKSHPSSPHTTITMSMLGQPPTVDDTGEDSAVTGYRISSEDLDLDVLLEKVCGERTGNQNFRDIILREKIDEKDSLLMDVPVMRPPNEHSLTDIFLPTHLAGLLMSPTSAPAQPVVESLKHESVHHGFLKKVKGLQSLSIELSWRPFKFGSTVPTNEEVAEVCIDMGDNLIQILRTDNEEVEAKLSNLLGGTLHFDPEAQGGDSMCPSTRITWDDGLPPCNPAAFGLFQGDDDIIYTRAHRRRIYGTTDGDEDFGSSDKENECNPDQGTPLYVSHDDPERPAKRFKMDLLEDVEEAESISQQLVSNDSGVFLLSPPADTRRGHFTQLAYGAEGFVGSDMDGDLFPDMDPVHEIELHTTSQTGGSRYLAWSAELGRSSAENTLLDRYFSSAMCALGDSTADDFAYLGELGDIEMPQNQVLTKTEAIAGTGSEPCRNRAHNLETARNVCPSSLHLEGLLARKDADQVSNQQTKLSSPNMSRGAMPAASAEQSLTRFLRLVGRSATDASEDAATSQLEVLAPGHDWVPAHTDLQAVQTTLPPVPEELIDQLTLCIDPESIPSPGAVHRYMASVDLIQKRALIRHLNSRRCAVDLVERDYLDAADLVVDPDSAVLFTSLAALPSAIDALTTSLSSLSWRFRRLLVVFEAFPVSQAFREGSPKPMPNPFSPAVIKSVKKLRRDLSIAEACEAKHSKTVIYFGFATSVQDAALCVRQFGGLIERSDVSGGVLWGERSWLDIEEQEGEYDLANVPGMNTFAATVVLSQMTLDDFLNLTADERTQMFTPLLGYERVLQFNKELWRRTQAAQIEY